MEDPTARVDLRRREMTRARGLNRRLWAVDPNEMDGSRGGPKVQIDTSRRSRIQRLTRDEPIANEQGFLTVGPHWSATGRHGSAQRKRTVN